MQQKLLFCCVRFDKGLLYELNCFFKCVLVPLSVKVKFAGFCRPENVPSDFWRRHFLVHDDSFRKLGNCDFHRVSDISRPLGWTLSSLVSSVIMLSKLGRYPLFRTATPSLTYSIKPRNCCVTVPGLPYSFSLNQTLASLLCLLAT